MLLSFFKNLSIKKKFAILGSAFLAFSFTSIFGMAEISKTTYFQKLERDHIELTTILSFYAEEYVELREIDSEASRSEAEKLLNRRSDDNKKKGIYQLLEEMDQLRKIVLSDTNVMEKTLFRFFGFERIFELTGAVGPELDRTVRHSIDQLERNELTITQFEEKFLSAVTGLCIGSSEFAPLVYNAALFVRNLMIITSLIFLFCTIFLLLMLALPLNASLQHLTNASKIIADGDFGKKIIIDQKDEIGQLADAFGNMQHQIHSVSEETNALIRHIRNGKLDMRGNAEDFSGGWRELIDGINSLIDAFAAPINMTAGYIDRISMGDFPDEITEEYKGGFDKIKTSINRLISNLRETVRMAEKIAEGDLGVRVATLSDKDMLGISLTRMVKTIKMIVRNVNDLTDAALEGKLDIRGDADRFGGEYAQIIRGVNETLDAVVMPLRTTAGYVARISKGDIPDFLAEAYKGDFNDIRLNLNTMIQNLARFAVDVQASAEQVAIGSEELSSSADQISQGTSEQSAGVEEISSSMEEMSGMVSQSAENAKQTALIADKAARDAQEGRKAVNETVQAMKTISGKIMIIEEIANQTNLLALNAAIEAARAGIHGKGFAVVAAEVRDLAKNTRNAAQDINTLSVKNLEIAERTGMLLKEMVGGIQKTAELVREISASGTEQATGIGEVNSAMQQLDLVIQQNAASTEEMASSSREFSDQAERLLEAASFFEISEKMRKKFWESADRTAAEENRMYFDLEAMPESARKMLMTYMKPLASSDLVNIEPVGTDSLAAQKKSQKNVRKETGNVMNAGEKNSRPIIDMQDSEDSEFKAF